MLALSLLWLVLGGLIGSLAWAGHVRLAHLQRRGWAALLAIGLVAALVGGWLGTLVYGRFFGTATAVWLAVLAVVSIPWTLNHLHA